jgi:hypothetical protein
VGKSMQTTGYNGAGTVLKHSHLIYTTVCVNISAKLSLVILKMVFCFQSFSDLLREKILVHNQKKKIKIRV